MFLLKKKTQAEVCPAVPGSVKVATQILTKP